MENEAEGVRYFCSSSRLRASLSCLGRLRGRCSSRMWSIQSSAVPSDVLDSRFTLSRALTRESAICSEQDHSVNPMAEV